MTDDLDRVVNVKQTENEKLLEYVKMFNKLRDVATNQLGREFFHKFMEMQIEYRELTDPQSQQDMKDSAMQRWMAYLLIRGSDQVKYGTLTKVFVSHYSLGSNQYPRSIITATRALSNHRIDPWYYENKECNHDTLISNHKNRDTDN